MQDSTHHMTVSGSGNAINVGGANNSATVNFGGGAKDAVDEAVRAIGALAADVDGPARVALEYGADDIAATSDKARLAVSLKQVQDIITGVSSSVSTAAGAAAAVGAAMRALDL